MNHQDPIAPIFRQTALLTGTLDEDVSSGGTVTITLDAGGKKRDVNYFQENPLTAGTRVFIARDSADCEWYIITPATKQSKSSISASSGSSSKSSKCLTNYTRVGQLYMTQTLNSLNNPAQASIVTLNGTTQTATGDSVAAYAVDGIGWRNGAFVWANFDGCLWTFFNGKCSDQVTY
jgi:hypothetical protein